MPGRRPRARSGGVTIPKDELVALCRRWHIRWLALFGSALTDDFRPDSDIDVLVEFEPGQAPGLAIMLDMAREALQAMEGVERGTFEADKNLHLAQCTGSRSSVGLGGGGAGVVPSAQIRPGGDAAAARRERQNSIRSAWPDAVG